MEDTIHTKHTDAIARETQSLELEPLSKAECRFERVSFLKITTSCPQFLWTYCIFDIGKEPFVDEWTAQQSRSRDWRHHPTAFWYLEAHVRLRVLGIDALDGNYYTHNRGVLSFNEISRLGSIGDFDRCLGADLLSLVSRLSLLSTFL
jgi:hypothetical protein